MKVRKSFNRLELLFLTFLLLSTGYAGTLEDIRNKLNANRNNLTNEKKEIIDLKNLKPGNLQGWKTKSTRNKPINAYALFASFKINKRTDSYPLPLTFCYIFDKDKNLIDRFKPGMLFGLGNKRGYEIEGDVVVPGKRILKIAFPYPADLVYKYAICVMGNHNNMSVHTYPRSTNWQDFNFDEKAQLLKQ